MKERRQHIRINDSLKVSYQVIKSFRLVVTQSKDVSEGGISLPILQRLSPGMVIDLEIYLSDSQKPIKATGEIMWLKEIKDLKFPYMVGIKFLKIDSASLNRIRTYVLKKLNKEKEVGWIE
ncbi:MAG: PilZ domain-containing protein [Candidatus Omnitrophica bacterium]|nr:PilZ domain-containing protein [Candidatus Omnitrophota bacterium]MDD5429642.1 PilZ domain-containing protein [Candidatus Omnitrophota bacterium]